MRPIVVFRVLRRKSNKFRAIKSVPIVARQKIICGITWFANCSQFPQIQRETRLIMVMEKAGIATEFKV